MFYILFTKYIEKSFYSEKNYANIVILVENESNEIENENSILEIKSCNFHEWRFIMKKEPYRDGVKNFIMNLLKSLIIIY